jgi:hypothetical protein
MTRIYYSSPTLSAAMKASCGMFDLAELAHLLLAFFLLVEELALAADVAAIAFRKSRPCATRSGFRAR